MNKRDELITKRDALEAKALASEDVNEVRAINEQIKLINELVANLDREERSEAPENAELRGGNPLASYGQKAETGESRGDEEPTSKVEYRRAFMKFVQTGTEMPAELRGDVISTDDTGAAIPLTVMNEVINTVRKRYGNLYSKVRKTAVRAGVAYPYGALQAKFKWINESTVSPRQKVGSTARVTFGYHVAEIRIAQTFLSNIVTLEAFENKIAEIIAIAYLQAMDDGIVNGTGDGQMLGILNDPRVTKTVTMTAAQLSDWTAWRKNFFKTLPLGYRAGEFIFPVSTVDAYLETMADANNNPIFRQATGLEVNDGDAMNPNGRFFGRDISLVEPDILPDFDAASSNDVIGIYWQPDEYAINENFGFTMRRYFDEETNEWVDKALVVVDGKVLNPEGYVLIKKG